MATNLCHNIAGDIKSATRSTHFQINQDNTMNSKNSSNPINPSNPSNLLTPRYVVITPVRNEAPYIGKTIDSMVNQTILPREWIIVNDGSTDATPKIIDQASRQYPWIKVIHRSDRGFRNSAGGVIEAFYDGYAALSYEDWNFIVKLDGDLSFKPDYFEACLVHFAEDSKLGLGGGVVWSLVGGKLINDGRNDPKFHVRGATKIYRRDCWEQISPLMKAPGWDTIDEVMANMLGWRTYTFRDVNLIQLKATGSADGRWGNAFKNGKANYVTGYHPLFMIAKCIKRGFFAGKILEAAGLWAGFCSGYIKKEPRVRDTQIIRYLRKQQILRMLGRPSIYG